MGMSALPIACLNKTFLPDTPLALAVRMKSSSMISSMEERVVLVTARRRGPL
jgi:hypothetical protein